MVRRSTWFALVILAVLIVVFVYLRQNNNDAAQAVRSPTSESQPLFPAEAAQPMSIKIDAGAQGSIAMIRDGNDWLIKQPVEAKADPAQVEAAVTQINALRIISKVDLSPADAGLTQPAYTFTIGFVDGDRHILIGDQTPTGSGYYARLEDGSVVILSAEGIQSLLSLLASPPYAETPTPSPAPATETPIPAEDTPTPGTPAP